MAELETEAIDINRRTNEAIRIVGNSKVVKDLKGRVEDWKGHKLENPGELLLHGQFLILSRCDQRGGAGEEVCCPTDIHMHT